MNNNKKEVIYGNAPSKSNCYKIITMMGKDRKLKPSLGKSSALKDYEKKFFMQLSGNLRNKNIAGLFEFHVDVYYPSMRSDLDNSLKIILDCLQKARAIKNDNKCVKIVAQKFIDKGAPRIEFEIKEII